MYSFLAAAPWFSSTKSCKNPVNMQLFGVQKKFAKSIGFATSFLCYFFMQYTYKYILFFEIF